MAAARTQQKDLLDFFGRDVALTHSTNSTTETIVTGPVQFLGIHFDATESLPANSFTFGLELDGTEIKRGVITALGTREVTFMGRFIPVKSQLVITRPGGDTATLFYTLIYKERPAV